MRIHRPTPTRMNGYVHRVDAHASRNANRNADRNIDRNIDVRAVPGDIQVISMATGAVRATDA